MQENRNIRQKSVFVGFMGGGAGVRMCKREREADRQAENAKELKNSYFLVTSTPAGIQERSIKRS